MAFKAPTNFNLQNGQRAERKLLITVAEWEEISGSGSGATTTTQREFLGRRTEDSSIELNPDIATSTDILGYNYTDVNKTQPQQSFDPFLILGGSRLAAILNDCRRRNALSELSQFTIYVISAFQGSAGSYECEKHTDCTIAIDSIGGDSNVNMPITVYFSNKITTGTVNKLSDDFVFTADVSVGG